MEAEARQVAAEGPRRALDQEAWPQLLRLQEPCERGRQAQADPALCGDRCGRARQPGAGWAVGRGNTCNDVFADSAYRSAEIEAKLRASGYNSRIHRRGRRNHALSLAQVRANHAKSRIRARIEHVFGSQQSAPGGRIVRTIGMVRARAKIGLQNLAYNIRRLVTLERLAAA